MADFPTWVNIPVRIRYDRMRMTGDGWNSPHTRSRIELNGVEFVDEEGNELKTLAEVAEFITIKEYADLQKEAEEYEGR